VKFVIFHGSFGSPEGNWFPELKEKLGYLGQVVEIPSFPVDDWEELTKAGPKAAPRRQNLEKWLEAFEMVAKGFKSGEKLCFVGHSLGCLFILHAIERFNLQLDSAIFVSPFLTLPPKMWQIDLVNRSFYKVDFDFEKLRRHIPISYVLYSDNDPYVDRKYSLDFAGKLGSSAIFVKGAAHMNIEVNLNEFPLVYELCKTRLDLSLYQRYLAHRRELFAVPYIKGKTEEIVYIDPREGVLDEGLFHFRNLQREGFATFYTATTFWEPHSDYMQEARKAGRRTKNLIRVFMVADPSNLDRPMMREQIRLDIKGGINVYLCLYDEVKTSVPEPDFGIWDGEYVCIVRFDRNNKPTEIELNSRRKDMDEARRWRQEILKKAVLIANADTDIDAFIRKKAVRKAD